MNQQEKEQQALAFQRECFESAQKHLAEKGVLPQTVFEKESRFLAPLCAVWKFKTQNGKSYWVISGRLPTDHAEVSAASNAREAMRYFSLQWQIKAEQILSSVRIDKTQHDFANLLIKRAHGLYELYDNDNLWANEPS
ncbi:DUF4826 family protein [Pseudoalteromonas sp. SSDWG2]|uniref:DUF4826 family protein n=1 Tax=Pseudoalteromonas sp. SSDWG2 TaxID=3139391 RepID=UPI003BAB0562